MPLLRLQAKRVQRPPQARLTSVGIAIESARHSLEQMRAMPVAHRFAMATATEWTASTNEDCRPQSASARGSSGVWSVRRVPPPRGNDTLVLSSLECGHGAGTAQQRVARPWRHPTATQESRVSVRKGSAICVKLGRQAP